MSTLGWWGPDTVGAVLIVFRETLEAALFVGIVAAATRGVAGRSRWLGGGVASGFVGALALAALADRVGAWADGMGQDWVNVGVLGLALSMLVWHCVWVPVHARGMAREARELGRSVEVGQRAPWDLALVAGLAVLREGAETVLFVSGYVTASGPSGHGMLIGCVLGLAAGAAAGALLYFGLSRVPAHRLFGLTQWLMILLAGSIASQLARALSQVGWLEAWSVPLWDTSPWLSMQSAWGAVLHALVGYDAQPSGMQLLFYGGAIALITVASRQMQRRAG
ncbi:FTR1 family protein [Aquabacterium sp.]|uniref:FTR1 family iron permease n=1 Tax=Aquabacterium sp. TaxID=1872578 RepID=UPI0035AEC888